MCLACSKHRERIRALNQRLAAAFAHCERAYDDMRALVIDTSGPTRRPKQAPPAPRPLPRPYDAAPPAARGDKAGTQLTLAL